MPEHLSCDEGVLPVGLKERISEKQNKWKDIGHEPEEPEEHVADHIADAAYESEIAKKKENRDHRDNADPDLPSNPRIRPFFLRPDCRHLGGRGRALPGTVG